MLRMRLAVALLLSMFCSLARAAEPLPPIPRIFPPVGTKPDEATSKKLRGLVEELERDLRPFDPRGKDDAARENLDETLFADVAIYPKAVRFALDYDEFYKPTDIADAEKLLAIGRARLKELQDGVKEPSWTKQRGLVVRGYISAIDDSVQPYGLHIPDDLDLSKKPPLYIWLHGRQEKTLDLQFITERAKSKGKFAADDAITVHPFGRYNNAFKFAGEIDVLDVMQHVEFLYDTDPERRVLMGFSMGGAGCWHIGAHYPHKFCAMAPGAGFVESRKFLKIKDDALPPWYEQVLWQEYDVPSYTRNLFNLPVIAYSGEKDGQKQAADVMEAEFAKHGKKLNHIIGPGMGHDYDKASLEKIRQELKEITAKEKPLLNEIFIQTPIIPYASNRHVFIHETEKHWSESRMTLEILRKPKQIIIDVTTDAVISFGIYNDEPIIKNPSSVDSEIFVTIDGQKMSPEKISGDAPLTFKKTEGKWVKHDTYLKNDERYRCGIDAAFCQKFIFVTPTGKYRTPENQAWVEREMAYQIDRWRRTFRGDPIVVKDCDLTESQKRNDYLILWGDQQSNLIIKHLYKALDLEENAAWNSIRKFEQDNLLLIGIGPKPIGLIDKKHSNSTDVYEYSNPRYFVLNSGPTFRDEHDRNNANQTPKLPDWAVIDVTTPGDAKSPGKIVTAGFFDNDWKYVDPAKQQAEFEARQKQ